MRGGGEGAWKERERREDPLPILCLIPRDVKVSVSFPKTIFRYWSSKALQRGVECSLDAAKLSLSFNLTLVPVESNLIQRHRANWTITSFSGCGLGIKADIKKSVDPATEEDEVEHEKDHVTSMLLLVEK